MSTAVDPNPHALHAVPGPMTPVPHHKVAAVAAWGLTIQFVATLGWIVVSVQNEGATGLGDLVRAMGDYFLRHVDSPAAFTLMNIYNASFGITAIVLMVLMREPLKAAPVRMQLATLAITVAATLFLASGIIPIASQPALASGEPGAVMSIVGITTGLVLGATTAAGFGLSLTAWSGLSLGFMPRLLCWIILIDGMMQIAEFTVPAFLVLDPFAGSIWSCWLGLRLWQGKR